MAEERQLGFDFLGALAGNGRRAEGSSPRPHAGWAVRVEYDPDAGNRAKDFEVLSEVYAKRFQARRRHPNLTSVPEVDARMMAPVTRESGRRWKPVHIVGTLDTLAKWLESPLGRVKQMRESVSFDYDYTDTAPGRSPTSLIDTEFVPLMFGPFYKQLYIYDYLLMHARAFELVNHSALAAAITKIMRRFTVGRGISFHIKHPQARAVWEEFWERNRMRERVRQMAHDLSWQGELLLRYYDKPTPGYMSMRVLDASTCWEVVTDPEDIDHVYYYHFQWPTPYQIWVSGQIPISKYVIQQIPPTNIQHVKMNVSSQEKRGRSDLLPAMPWIKRFGDFYNGVTVKAMLEANLVWKIKVKGDQADVDAFLSNPALTQLPPPGGQWVENESVNLEAISAQLTSGARGSAGIGQQIASIVAVSVNLPPEYMNIETGGPARATALVRTDPAVKAIEDRQQIVRETIEDMYDRVLSSAIMAGRISREAAREEPETRPDEDVAFDPDAEPMDDSDEGRQRV